MAKSQGFKVEYNELVGHDMKAVFLVARKKIKLIENNGTCGTLYKG